MDPKTIQGKETEDEEEEKDVKIINRIQNEKRHFYKIINGLLKKKIFREAVKKRNFPKSVTVKKGNSIKN